MEKETIFKNDLLKRMWITRGARYNAFRRLKKKHDLSITTIAFLSSYALIINAIKFVNFIELKAHHDNYISFFTMVISVLILVLSLLDSSKDYQMNADKLYISAIEIENLYNELKQVQLTTMPKKEKDSRFKNISSAYGRILQLYQVNHELIDYNLLFNNRKRLSFYGNFIRNFIYFKALILPFIFYNLIIIFTPVLFILFLLII